MASILPQTSLSRLYLSLTKLRNLYVSKRDKFKYLVTLWCQYRSSIISKRMHDRQLSPCNTNNMNSSHSGGTGDRYLSGEEIRIFQWSWYFQLSKIHIRCKTIFAVDDGLKSLFAWNPRRRKDENLPEKKLGNSQAVSCVRYKPQYKRNNNFYHS